MVDGFYDKKIKRDKESIMKIIQVSYILFFYGYNRKDKSKVENIKNWILTIANVKEIPLEWSIMLKSIQDEFIDHQSQLSHYYRNLFQTVKYINGSATSTLDYSQKYDYVKIIRAQLSNYEQALLFYNSISPLGSAWELESNKVENDQLITKYNMIKNLPHKILRSLDPKLFYPNVYYEYDSAPTSDRIKLVKLYK
ncbi:MAG: putative phage abortive infection protein [Ignavibacteriales bacterium]|nr:putative phage abortive infection protein [Ignavibacteriales bacterium]